MLKSIKDGDVIRYVNEDRIAFITPSYHDANTTYIFFSGNEDDSLLINAPIDEVVKYFEYR